MVSDSVWVVGTSRSGKTTRLAEQFCDWLQIGNQYLESFYTNNSRRKKNKNRAKTANLKQTQPGVLVLAANDDNRRELGDMISTLTSGKYPVRAKTVLGFFQDEVILFWPLLIQSLQLKAQFPVRLRPETEQELATKLWRTQLNEEILRQAGVNEYRFVRRVLDLWQLAAYSGVACEDITPILHNGLQEDGINLEADFLVSLLLTWRSWCLQRGLLTYGMITELYGQHLLTNVSYQQRLQQRFQAVLADDVDDYPAIAYNLFSFLLDRGAVGAFSYNLDGAIRLGLGADPEQMQLLASRCQVESLSRPPGDSLAAQIAMPMVELVTQPIAMLSLPEFVQPIQTTSRAQLLRQTAELITQGVKSHQVEPQEIAVIAPGLDAIARYTLTEILTKDNIAVESLNDQRPLISSPSVRALLTLLALVYPGLGRLVDRDAVAEMLVILSRKREKIENLLEPSIQYSPLTTDIDPVRAGLLADNCFVPHPENPHLLPVTAYERWDRIGYAATTAYNEILAWIEQQQVRLQQRLIPSPISFLYAAIQDFLYKGNNPPYQQLAALRELLETAQHYWEVDARLRQTDSPTPSLITTNTASSTTITEFIQLLRRGTITANPYPIRPIGGARKAVTLANIFQYRSLRKSHRWQFWLDTGSPLWAKGGAANLFGANLFLRHRLGQPWTAEDEKTAEDARLKRILADLLARVTDRVYLCHSELAVNGQEQMGPLLPLVHACVAVDEEEESITAY